MQSALKTYYLTRNRILFICRKAPFVQAVFLNLFFADSFPLNIMM